VRGRWGVWWGVRCRVCMCLARLRDWLQLWRGAGTQLCLHLVTRCKACMFLWRHWYSVWQHVSSCHLPSFCICKQRAGVARAGLKCACSHCVHNGM
jgi:hypothetical protein